MLVIAGLILAFVLVAIYSNPRMRQCRWREDRSVRRDGLTRYRCAACGAETFSDGPPRNCLRGR